MNDASGGVTSEAHYGWIKEEKSGSVGGTGTSINKSVSFKYIESQGLEAGENNHKNIGKELYSETSGSLINGFGDNEILQTYSHLNGDENKLINQFLMDQLNLCSDNSSNMF